MTVPARITLITLGVTDFDRAVRFYEALGWRRSSASTDDTAFFLTGGAVLALWGHENLAADAGRADAGDRPPTGGVSLAINVESEAEVDGVLAAAAAAGATITKPAEKAFWGGYTGNFTDPDGHLWETAHNPYWPFNDDGSVRLPE